MLSKILLTLAVIMVCLWLLSAKRAGGSSPARKMIVSPERLRFNKTLQRTAIAFMIFMVLAATGMIYIEIADQREIMVVHVVNTQTGEKISYQARKDDIQSSEFTTVEGRRIFVAGIERVEIEALD